MNEVIRLIGSHNSVREFNDKNIEETTFRTILSTAQYASTSSFLQAYSVIRVNDKETRKKIMSLCGDQPYIEEAAEFLVFCADLNRLTTAASGHGVEVSGGFTESFIIATVDASLFAQNVMLASESLGIGGVYIGAIRNNPSEICELLEIPNEVYPVFGMCLGYPDSKVDMKPRLPLGIILKEEKYTQDNKILMDEYDKKINEYYFERTKGKVNSTWTEKVASRMEGELRPHMKVFLEKQNLNHK